MATSEPRKLQPIRTPPGQRMADFRRRRLPIVVWSVCAAICAFMLFDRAAGAKYVGLARGLEYEISAVQTGRVQDIVVTAYDMVEAGEIVARLADDGLRSDIATAGARVQQLRAELEAMRVELTEAKSTSSADRSVDLRRFQMDEERRRLDALQLRVTIGTEEVELERLSLEMRRSAPLLEAGLLGQNEFDRIRLTHDELKRGLEENRFLLSETEREYESARRRRLEFESTAPSSPALDSLLEPLRRAIAVETRELEALETAREALTLRSPVSGQVRGVFCQRGQAVRPGEPIVTITDAHVTEVIAFIDENDSLDVSALEKVTLASRSQPGQVAESLVVRVGQGIEQLPPRLWLDPARPRYGRPVVIAAVPSLLLRPDELVYVEFLGN